MNVRELDFDLASLSSGDSVGNASITTNSQTINAVLYATTVFSNYAIIIANDSNGSTIGFFTLENLTTGIKVSATSPPDGNDYTSGLTSYVAFTDIFVTPDYAGVLNFFTDIESELNEHENAISHYLMALEMGGTSPDIYYNLAMSYAYIGNYMQALLGFQNAYKLNSDDDLIFQIAMCYKEMEIYYTQ